ncbi:MAG: tail fiber domain-containing protein [Planctomycetes bacterium]|nr:tail fiber domain-containing protein [Planctomycetota bacterium]
MSVRMTRLVLALGMLSATTLGQTAGMLSMQGLIKDSNGDPINSPVDLTFAVYDAETDGNLLAGPFGPMPVTPDIGVVFVGFGPVCLGVFDGGQRWLEVSVDGSPLSRIEMATAPAVAEQVNIPATGTPAIVVDAIGNVGIGSTIPTAKLKVDGNLAVDGTIQSGNSIVIDGVNHTINSTDILEWQLDGQRFFVVTPSTDIINFPESPNFIFGHPVNNMPAPTVAGSVIAGGGAPGAPNIVTESFATISGGRANTAGGERSTIGGGFNNTASLTNCVVGGGLSNVASRDNASVGGGNTNTASGTSARVGGGQRNTADGTHSTVAGGRENVATGGWSTIPGGRLNEAAMDYSFAAGRRAKAVHQGAFIWADSADADHSSERNDQFRIRADGGARFDDGEQWVDLRDDDTNLINTSAGATLTLSGVWTNASDRALKENLEPVDGGAILARLSTLPIPIWNYKSEASTVRHIGPMAQDFYAAFHLGHSNTTIGTIDSDGIALSAIKALYEFAKDKDARIASQTERIHALQRDNAAINARLKAIEALINARTEDRP